MSTPEPLMVATAHHALRDVEAKLATWQDELAVLRGMAVTEFGRRLPDLEVPAGLDFGEVAEAHADVVIDSWCKQRESMIRMITGALNPDTIVVAQMVGMAGQLGELIGLNLDTAIRDLDSELREVIDAALRRGHPG